MKRLIISGLLAVLAGGGFGSKAVAQGSDRRVDVARFYGDQRNLDPAGEPWRGNDRRLADVLDQLSRDAARIGRDIRNAGDGNRGMRRRFAEATKKLDRLNLRFRRGGDRRDLWRDAQNLRAEFSRIDADLRKRSPARRR